MARFAANLTFLFTELPMLDRFAAAKAAVCIPLTKASRAAVANASPPAPISSA